MKTSLNDIIQRVQNTNWTKINNFNIILMPLSPEFANIIGWELSNEFNDQLNTSLISIDTPTYTNQEVAEFIGGMWRYHDGRDEMFRFTLTFRDYDQFKLYRTFANAYYKMKDAYFDSIRFVVQVYAGDDKRVKDRLIFKTDTAIIENLSQLQFNHSTENQIAEFSVGFKSRPLIIK